MAGGGFLLWKLLGKGHAGTMYELHPWMASMGVYVASLPVGLGLNMFLTGFSFMKPESQEV